MWVCKGGVTPHSAAPAQAYLQVSKRVGRLVDRILWHPVPFLVSTFPLFMLALCASALAFAWASAGLARRTAALSSATRHGGSNLMDLKALNVSRARCSGVCSAVDCDIRPWGGTGPPGVRPDRLHGTPLLHLSLHGSTAAM